MTFTLTRYPLCLTLTCVSVAVFIALVQGKSYTQKAKGYETNNSATAIRASEKS